ncbi:MAG TPA: hypothetical protein DCO65_08650 [Spartobacteria bacterium]|nr:hypothetical protein [Spartobacteria bacterium]
MQRPIRDQGAILSLTGVIPGTRHAGDADFQIICRLPRPKNGNPPALTCAPMQVGKPPVACKTHVSAQVELIRPAAAIHRTGAVDHKSGVGHAGSPIADRNRAAQLDADAVAGQNRSR